MTTEQLAQMGFQLRTAQRQYFKTRTRVDLVIAKECERRFDVAVQEILNPVQQAQATLL